MKDTITKVRSAIYSFFSFFFTSGIYIRLNEVFRKSFKDGDTLCEIGPGTGNNLKYLTCLPRRLVNYVGIDLDDQYATQLEREVQDFKNPQIHSGPSNGNFLTIYGENFDPRITLNEDGTTHILLIECTMLMPKDEVVRKIRSLVDTCGDKKLRFYFSHTEFPDDLHWAKRTIFNWVKPYLYYFTTIHFGRPTYSSEFNEILKKTSLEVIEGGDHTITHNGGENTFGKLKLYITKPKSESKRGNEETTGDTTVEKQKEKEDSDKLSGSSQPKENVELPLPNQDLSSEIADNQGDDA